MTFLSSLPRTVAALALSAALALPAVANDAGALKALELSAELYARGLDSDDPLLILAAAKLRRGFDFTPDAGTPEGAGTPVTWEQMLDAARELAAGDEAMLAMIDDVAEASSRGVTTGQVYHIKETIDVGGDDVYGPLPFDAGEYAEVYVESNDGSDLNLYIYDAEGRLVCSDTDSSSISYCGWRPAEAGVFTIKVENRGAGNSGYAIMTN